MKKQLWSWLLFPTTAAAATARGVPTVIRTNTRPVLLCCSSSSSSSSGSGGSGVLGPPGGPPSSAISPSAAAAAAVRAFPNHLHQQQQQQQQRRPAAPLSWPEEEEYSRQRRQWQREQRSPLLEDERRSWSSYGSVLDESWEYIRGDGGSSSSSSLSSSVEDSLGLRRVLSGLRDVIAGKVMNSTKRNDDNTTSSGIRSAAHPFIATAGSLFFPPSSESDNTTTVGESPNDILTPGVVVLLVERALRGGGASPSSVLSLSRSVVKTCGGYLIHRTVVEGEDDESHAGNKLATLTGDLLVISLIKDVAHTKSNKVLELTMESLSEFSVSEVRAARGPFTLIHESVGATASYKFVSPSSPFPLAESWVVSRGLESVGVLLGLDAPLLRWLGEVGAGVGTLWKVHFDLRRLGVSSGRVVNAGEMHQFATNLGDNILKRLQQQQQRGAGFVKDREGIVLLERLVKQWVHGITTSSSCSS